MMLQLLEEVMFYKLELKPEKMKEIAQHNAPTEFISGKPSMIPTRKIDSNKIKNKLGWEAKTPLEEGLLNAYNWYLENKKEFE